MSDIHGWCQGGVWPYKYFTLVTPRGSRRQPTYSVLPENLLMKRCACENAWEFYWTGVWR